MTGAATLVLYDEDCGICVAFAQILDRRGVPVSGLGSPLAGLWLRDLAPHERAASFHAVDDRGRRRSGGDAVPLVLLALGHARAARVAASVPGTTDLAYRAVARSRGALSRALGQRVCRAPVDRVATRASRGRAG